MNKIDIYILIIIVVSVLVPSFFILQLFEALESEPYEITEIVCGTVDKVEGHTIYFKNDSYSGIVKDDDSIRWDWNYVYRVSIDNPNEYNLSWFPGYFIEMRIKSVMNENDYLESTIISVYMDKKK